MRNNQIIPAILATTEEEYRTKLEKIESCPDLAQGWVQIDLMDNKFVQSRSIGGDVIRKYSTSLKREAQLMVRYPENWIEELVKVDIERIVFPVEDSQGIEERIWHIKNHGLQAGLSINPSTPVAKLDPFMDKIEVVLIMSVYPGFGGQKFLPQTMDKVKEAAGFRKDKGLKFLIEVDGGINEGVVKGLAEAGADNLIIGSHLIDGNITENLEKIWQALRS